MSVVSPLLATGMPHSNHRASTSVPHSATDYGTACSTPGSIPSSLFVSRTLTVLLLLLRLLLLLGLLLLLSLLLLVLR
jgi:hypothetical protein